MLTLRSEAAGKQLQTPSIEFLDKDMVEDIQHCDRELTNHETTRFTDPILR
jgi:hypothetical protein